MDQDLTNRPIYVDTTQDLISMLMEFDKISINMAKSKSLKEFDHWFHKCFNLDRRCTLLFLRKYIDKIPNDYIFYAELYLNEKIKNNINDSKNHKINDADSNIDGVDVYDLRDREKVKGGIKLRWKK